MTATLERRPASASATSPRADADPSNGGSRAGHGPLRVGMIAACPFPARRGTPVRVQRLAEALTRLGHEVEVLTYHLREGRVDPGVKTKRIFGRAREGTLPPGPSLGKLLAYDPALAWLSRRSHAERPYHVIHAHHVEGLAAGWFAAGPAAIRKAPLVFDVHTTLRSELPSYGPLAGVTARLGEWLDARLPKLADRVVTVTDDIRRHLVDGHGLNPNRVTVAANGVEVEALAAPSDSTPVPGRVFYSGTLASYQDFGLLLRAFAKAKAQRPHLSLLCSVGPGFERYREDVARLRLADAIKVVPDDFELLPERLAASAVAVVPRTLCDGIPQKLLNYMAAGRPVVVSAGSAKVNRHEVDSLIVPNGNAEGMADAIVRLIDRPELAERLAANAKARMIEGGGWNRTAETCVEVYREAIARMPLRGR